MSHRVLPPGGRRLHGRCGLRGFLRQAVSEVRPARGNVLGDGSFGPAIVYDRHAELGAGKTLPAALAGTVVGAVRKRPESGEATAFHRAPLEPCGERLFSFAL